MTLPKEHVDMSSTLRWKQQKQIIRPNDDKWLENETSRQQLSDEEKWIDDNDECVKLGGTSLSSSSREFSRHRALDAHYTISKRLALHYITISTMTPWVQLSQSVSAGGCCCCWSTTTQLHDVTNTHIEPDITHLLTSKHDAWPMIAAGRFICPTST